MNTIVKEVGSPAPNKIEYDGVTRFGNVYFGAPYRIKHPIVLFTQMDPDARMIFVHFHERLAFVCNKEGKLWRVTSSMGDRFFDEKGEWVS